MIFPILVIALLILIPLVASAEHKTQNATVFSMCSLTDEEPYYDCNIKWVAIIGTNPVVYDLNGDAYSGFAYHSIASHDSPSSVCNYVTVLREQFPNACGLDWFVIGTLDGDGCWNGECKSMFQHETDHLKCKCNWHEGLERTVILYSKV